MAKMPKSFVDETLWPEFKELDKKLKTQNKKLLSKKIIKKRLRTLKEGYASCAIEGLYITKEDRTFMENMVINGLNPDEMIREIKKRMAIEAV